MSESTVREEKILRASPEALFRAFTDETYLPWWFAPDPDAGTRVDELDLRVGGAYRFTFNFPDGTSTDICGVYREIEAPKRLVFTWTWPEPNSLAGTETVVNVSIEPHELGGKVTIVHEGLTDVADPEHHAEGWRATLNRLDHAIQRGTLSAAEKPTDSSPR